MSGSKNRQRNFTKQEYIVFFEGQTLDIERKNDYIENLGGVLQKTSMIFMM